MGNKTKEIAKVRLESLFEARVIFECSMSIGGCSYLVIYGRHVNGYFCCVPGEYSAEMAEPSDTFYNSEKLMHAGAPEWLANGLARGIKTAAEAMEKNAEAEEAAEVEKKFNAIFESASAGSK